MRVVVRPQEVLPPIAPEVSWLKSGVRGKVRFELAPREENGHLIGEAVYAYVDGKQVAELLSRERHEDCPPDKDCFELSEEVKPEWRGKGIGAETLMEYIDDIAKRYHENDILFFVAFTGIGKQPWWRKTVDAILYPYEYVRESID